MASSCTEEAELERRLASFEVALTTPVGSPDRRCPLPGTPTATIDLTGCPAYDHEAGERTVVRVGFKARAIDNRGELLETYDGLARVRVVPGKVAAAFTQVRFRNGETDLEDVAFRAAFGDTFLWIVDDLPPPRSTDVPGLGRACGSRDSEAAVCAETSLACVNAKPEVGFDELGLAYCTKGCVQDSDCPSGYFCGDDFVAYGAELDDGACIRRVPTYAAGAAGPIHLVEPTLADVSRADSLISSPFTEDFIAVNRGKMIVTAVRIDGFYVTDLCPLPPEAGGPAEDDPRCTPEDRSLPPEFNHLFVFNFSRPEDLVPGDQLDSVSGPMSEFNGFTEMNFPSWEVDLGSGLQAVPPPIDLHAKILDIYPYLLPRGARCFNPEEEPGVLSLLDCDYAMERIEAARVSMTVKSVVRIDPGSPEERDLERFGQWPVIVDTGLTERQFSIVTRENIPFFDPRKLGGRAINQKLVGNLRQVAFDDRDPPIWIVEPRDQADCTWCTN